MWIQALLEVHAAWQKNKGHKDTPGRDYENIVNVTKCSLLVYIQNLTEQDPGLSWSLFEQK